MLKRIKSFFEKKRTEKYEILENKRKEIHAKLPNKSFSKKLYSFERLDKEIALLKIGNEIINVSGIRKKNAVNTNYQIVLELQKKYDLSKATLIHTHINQNRSTPFLINPSDLIFFSQFNQKFNTRRFEISMIDKNYVEYKRVFIKFSEKSINWIKNNNLKSIINEVHTADRLHFMNLTAGYMYRFLNEKGIIIKEVNLKEK